MRAAAAPLALLFASLPVACLGFPHLAGQLSGGSSNLTNGNATTSGGAVWRHPSKRDEELMRHQIRRILENPDPWWFDDGSYGPLLLRLAWHSSAHFSAQETPVGGSQGATSRFEPEKSYHDNRGLELAREILLPVLAEHPYLSISDCWILAGYEAVEALGGPHIEMAFGRIDATEDQAPEICPPEERFPAWDDSITTIREKFARLGMGDRDLVALIGAHTIGKAHPELMGFPFRNWDNSPVVFDSQYFDFVLSKSGTGPPDWREVIQDDPTRPGQQIRWFEPSSRGGWFMLPTDMMLRDDPALRVHAEEFYEDEAAFHAAFAHAFKRVTELGFMFRHGSKTEHGSFNCARALRGDFGANVKHGTSTKRGCPFGR